MSLSAVVCYNLLAVSIQIISAFFVGVVLLKRSSFGMSKIGIRRFFLIIACAVFMAVSAAVIYKTGMLQNPFVNILANYLQLLMEALAVSLVLKEKFQVCWSVVIFNGLIIDLSQSVSFIFASKEIYNTSVMQERREYMFYSMIVGNAVFLLILFLLYKMKAGNTYRRWIEHRDIWVGGLICLSAWPALTVMLVYFLRSSGISNSISWVLSLIMLIGILVVLNYVGREEQQRRESARWQLILQQQSIYIETLEGMQEEMRRFRHDYKNMMAGMYLQAKEGKLTEVSNFIQEMTDDFDNQIGERIQKMSQLRNIYMAEVKGLLLSKLKEMQGDGISCELEVMQPFYGAEFRTTDLCRCLGILIDNAIEEVRGKEDARVHIMISSQNGITTFRVKNALYHEVDFHKIWQQGYSTKGSGRGIGLASYKKILSGYDNVLPVTAVREGCFIQELKIQERDAG